MIESLENLTKIFLPELKNSDAVENSSELANLFKFSSEYYDSELNLIYYNYRHYDPETGRWLSREPLEESGSINLYSMCLNNSISIIDIWGFYYTEHNTLTETTLRNHWNKPIISSKQKKNGVKQKQLTKNEKTIMEELKKANNRIDSSEGDYNNGTPNIDNNRLHYNRNSYQNYNESDVQYSNSLKERIKEFEEALRKCECAKALNILGGLTHSWQDYYAHAIDRNTPNNKSINPGNMGIEFTPNNRDPKQGPSSWDGVFKSGQHGWSEPGNRATDGGLARRNAANAFVAEQYSNYLKRWQNNCDKYIKNGVIAK